MEHHDISLGTVVHPGNLIYMLGYHLLEHAEGSPRGGLGINELPFGGCIRGEYPEKIATPHCGPNVDFEIFSLCGQEGVKTDLSRID